MIYKIYAVRDALTGFMSLTLEQGDLAAMRSFGNALYMDRSFQLSIKDLDLYCLGDYDTDSGLITPCCPIRHVCDGVSAYTSVKESVSNVIKVPDSV